MMGTLDCDTVTALAIAAIEGVSSIRRHEVQLVPHNR